MNLRRPTLLLAACLASAMPHATRAADPAPPVRIEVTSEGEPASAIHVLATDLEKMRLEKPLVLAPDLTVTHAATGVFERDRQTGSFLFKPTKEIPLKTGQRFGWLVRTRTKLDSVRLSESFKLPRKNGTWSVDPDTTQISDDGLTATTTHEFPVWEYVFNVWTLEDGDPDGAHEFTIKLNDKEAAKLPFEIKKPGK